MKMATSKVVKLEDVSALENGHGHGGRFDREESQLLSADLDGLHRSNTQQSGKYFQIQLQLTCFVLFYFIY
jgi:hypothetical protein